MSDKDLPEAFRPVVQFVTRTASNEVAELRAAYERDGSQDMADFLRDRTLFAVATYERPSGDVHVAYLSNDKDRPSEVFATRWYVKADGDSFDIVARELRGLPTEARWEQSEGDVPKRLGRPSAVLRLMEPDAPPDAAELDRLESSIRR